MRQLKVIAIFALVVATMTGCFIFGTSHRESPITYDELQAKQRVTFGAGFDRVWDATLASLSTQKIAEIDRESGFITTREKNLSSSQLDDYAWHPDYGSFWYQMSNGTIDEARYWINVKVSAISDESTRVQITPNFEIHVRDRTWDTSSVMVWKPVRSRGVMEDIFIGRIARELGN